MDGGMAGEEERWEAAGGVTTGREEGREGIRV